MQIFYGERKTPAVSAEEVADFLGLAVGIVPPTLSHLIELATDLVERYTLRATSERNFGVRFRLPPSEIALPFPPLIQVESIRGWDDQAWHTVDLDDVKIIDTVPAKLIGSWPYEMLQVAFRAGNETIPVDLRDAILRVVAQRWELRSANVIPECTRLEDPQLWRQLESY